MRRGFWLGLLIALAGTRPAWAGGEACAQARDIVAEVQRAYEAGSPNHAVLLEKLRTARDLCPMLGDAWKYSYCSALALGKTRDAQIFRDRAAFAQVTDLSCPTAGGGAARPEAPLPGFVRDKYALVVGIGRFKDSAVPTLRFAAKDARDLYTVLVDPRYGRFDPSHVTLLTDEQATRANILNALQQIFDNAQEEDLVFLYISSHGSPQREDQGLGGVGFIVTYDTSLKNIYLDSLDYEGFSRQASLLKARRKAVFLDTCFSGQAFHKSGEKALFIDVGGVTEKTARLFLSGEGTYVVTSSRSNERSYESETLQNSYFTHYLIAALKSGDEPPTLKALFESLSRDVPAAVAREKGAPQHPQMVPANGLGDLRIGVAPRENATTGKEGRP